MKYILKLIIPTLLLLSFPFVRTEAQDIKVTDNNITIIRVSNLHTNAEIDPMIYGQMLEDCNDNVIYGGVVDNEGNENQKVIALLQPLDIPVMRWPGGTCVYNYFWKNGIGPKEERPVQHERIWHGFEPYTFGTDEFISWCGKIKASPYININMSNSPEDPSTLGDALDWIEYVNGAPTTPMGLVRKKNGHEAPYNVKYWCIGNENYLSNRFHFKETAVQYSENLYHWASTIKNSFPEVSLLGVGHYKSWNDIVLAKCGKLVDFLTLHFYVESKISGVDIQGDETAMFPAVRMNAYLVPMIEGLKKANYDLDREDSPVRFSIDEWNNRHSVNTGKGFKFTRKDDRRQSDIPFISSMLNVFIRNSPYIGMANYIFPVNGHGLVKTVGNNDAYVTPIYHVFRLYRKYMIGSRVDLEIAGPGLRKVRLGDLPISGDFDNSLDDETRAVTYVDGAATIDGDGTLTISVTNMSTSKKQKVRFVLPDGYNVDKVWTIQSDDITLTNNILERDNVAPKECLYSKSGLELKPCGFAIVRCLKSN